MPGVTKVNVSPAEAGQKLLNFLQRRVGDVPGAALLRWIRTGQVRVDGGRKKPFDRLQAGQRVRIPPYGEPEEKPGTNATADLEVVSENAETLVLAKPAGLPSHGGTGHADSIADRLAARYRGADFAPTLAHRLDKDTSGLLLVAKTYRRLRELNSLMAKGGLHKSYLAWVRGDWPGHQEELLEDRMEKSGRSGQEKVCTGAGKAALAYVTPLLRRNACTLLLVRLLTGRTHQIRVQLASRGHSIVGDRKYGPEREKSEHAGLLLHACHLELPDLDLTLPPAWADPWDVPERFLHFTSRRAEDMTKEPGATNANK
ncbi:MAG: RluA family pseudouridine synthase [Desulfovibrionaceae bacterium]